ncbi:MAG TPA: MopE-related protein, partial [Myxococcota bacterium]|nr:MopE-related protein [Myxococcota bacterium]
CAGERRCEREGLGGLSACDARTPVGELCNDIDDNCDGETDEGFSELGQTCDGDDSDACKDGVWICGATGALGCTDDLASQVERCNAVDDDCDGETDEDFVGLGEGCDGVDADLCKDGVWVCDGLSMVCDDDGTSKSETCNGLDDDCDGVVDDGYDVGTPCDGPADPDTCPDGAKVCNGEGTGTVCEDGPAGPVELCNGADDDCDGAVDEGFEAKNTPCDGEDFDGCADGVLVCSGDGTRLVCNDDGSSRVELCNELDDDCRAGPDDTFPLKLTACDGPDADQCPDGVFVCSADGLGLDCTDDGVSRIEVCNDLDDDCDGATDEDFTLKGQACDSEVDTDLCATGRWVCGGNTLVCNDDNASTTELCNGADDDCDGQADEVADLSAPLNPNQNGLCAGTRQRCAGVLGWAADYGGVAGFGQNETPDAGFVDENCDGLDGTEALAVFVRQGAANNGTCTKANPCGSLTYAITQTTGTRRHVYVQAGTYDNIVEVPSGKDIEIYGGFNSSWQRRPRTEAGHTVTLRGAKHPSDDEYLTVRVRSAT